MRFACRSRVRGALGVLLCAASAVGAQPAAETLPPLLEPLPARALTLTDSVRVTLTIEGAAPLRVELPKQLLTADADPAWRIRPDPPGRVATLTALGGGRERWQQVYRLTPYVPGTPLRAAFNPVSVVANGRATMVTWKEIALTVEVPKGELTIATRTELEAPPAPPVSPAPSLTPWLVAAGAAALAVVAVVVVMLVRKRRPKPVPAGEWARGALAKLEADDAETLAQLAAILREFVARQFGIPATTLTTAELSAAVEQRAWPVERAESLRAILDVCDRTKFAGAVPDAGGCQRLVRAAGEWVNDAAGVSRPST